MPDVMSNDELAALAAEYVLGTLDFEERKGAAALLEVDHTFRGLVRIWERRLGELHLMVEPVEPDPQLWERLKQKVVALSPGTGFAPAAEAAATEAATVEPAPALPGDSAAAAEASGEAAAAHAVAAEAAAEGPAKSDSAEARAAAAVPQLTPDVTANLIRELEEAARLVPSTAPSVAAAPPPPLIRRDVTGLSEVEAVSRPLRRWRLLAILTSLLAVVLAGLISAWRFIPEQLPPQLQAPSVLHLPVPEAAPPPPLPPPRPEPPPSFDE